MPSGNELQVAAYNTAQQFERLTYQAVNEPYKLSGYSDDYELLYSRDKSGGPGGSLGFAKRASSFWVRRRNRKQTREELANLINESFGRNFASVRRWGLFEESIGHRLLRDLAAQDWFSVTKIDEQALKEIARCIYEVQREIKSKECAFRQDRYRDNMTAYILSPKNLKMIYERAGAHPQGKAGRKLAEYSARMPSQHIPNEIRKPPKKPVKATPTTNAVATTSLKRPVPIPTLEESRDRSEKPRNSSFGVRSLPSQPNSQSAQEIAEFHIPMTLDQIPDLYDGDGKDEAKELPSPREQNPSAQAQLEKTLLNAVVEAGPGGMEFAMAQLYRTGADGVEKDMAQVAYWLIIADQKGSREAKETFARLMHDGDKEKRLALYKTYRYDSDYNEQRKALAKLERMDRNKDEQLHLALYNAYRHGGDGIKKDIHAAAYWFARAHEPTEIRPERWWLKDERKKFVNRTTQVFDNLALEDPPDLLMAMADLYHKGAEGVAKNRDTAYFLYHRAATRGHVRACFMAGVLGEEKNWERKKNKDRQGYDFSGALSDYKDAANLNDANAQYAMGRILLDRTIPNHKVMYCGDYKRTDVLKRKEAIREGKRNVEGAVLMLQAASQGHREAIAAIEKIQQAAGKQDDRPALRLAFRELLQNRFEQMQHEQDPFSTGRIVDHDEAPPSPWRIAENFGDVADSPDAYGALAALARFYKPECRGEWCNIDPALQNPSLALHFYFRAILQEKPISTDSRGYGLWVFEDCEKSNPGYVDEEFGRIFEEGRGVKPVDHHGALWHYERAAKKGNPRVQARLTELYQQGFGDRAPDPVRAMYWLVIRARNRDTDGAAQLRQIARHGPTDKQMTLAQLYRQGVPVPEFQQPDDPEAAPVRVQEMQDNVRLYERREMAKWYGHAALRGNREAQYQYALCIRDGLVQGVSGDGPYLLWLSRAAEQGHREAQFELAFFYQNHRNNPHGAAAFAKWVTRAATKGHDGAIALKQSAGDLGSPAPSPQDDPEAPDWWPFARDLIADNLDQCIAMAAIHDGRADAAFDEEVANRMKDRQGLLTVQKPEGQDRAVVQQALNILIHAYEELQGNGALTPDKLAKFGPVRDALQQHEAFLRSLTDAEDPNGSPIASRQKELARLIQTLTDAHDLAADIHRYRQENVSYAADTLRPIARDRGLTQRP